MYYYALAGYEQALGPDYSETYEVSSNLGALLHLDVRGEALRPQV